ncbi:hypothetical protein BcepF1.033 [Burkholderia phage BcepF1]|uniref:Uncharacterized protein n=1 Tax=Burkholderia phage BcepF1 TaxID=2886897 RepID=A1YZT7_9CAUD|nr:hypothetical protein BcepF1.033 [Burkholderia phage BcepF1]ABL96764.1 hypothetical protein BcepF1.033 [Burkholderia phage BcepF1]
MVSSIIISPQRTEITEMTKKIKPREIEGFDNAAMVTGEELAALLKRAPSGSKFVVHASMDAAIIDNPECVYTKAIRACLNVARAEAIRFAKGALSERQEARGARFRVYTSFYTRTYPREKEVTTYWIV